MKRRTLRLFAFCFIASAALPVSGALAPVPCAAQLAPAAPFSLPYGRLIKCRLACAAEGASAPAPLIGIVDEDLRCGGRTVIPAGSEIHGTVLKPEPALRDRLEAADAFVLPIRGGVQQTVQGVVLEREDADGSQGAPAFGAGDGTSGLKAHGPNARVDAGRAFYLYLTQELYLTQG